MGLHGVPQLVNARNGGIAGSVKADGIVGAANIVVDGGGDTNNTKGLSLLSRLAAESQSTSESAVTANGHNTV